MKYKTITLLLFTFLNIIVITNVTRVSAQEITPSPEPKLTKQQICQMSPECYWENPNCICANGRTPMPSGNITWNEVEGYNGTSFNADSVEGKPATSSGNIFKNAKPLESSAPNEQKTPTPVPTPSAPPFDVIQNIKKESDQVKIESIEKVTSTLTGTSQTNIKISGTGPANTYVFIYIFSDPIVVTVKTNEKGEWSYVLEKKLEKGDHKIYVAAETNNAEYIKSKATNIKVVPPAEAQGANSDEYDIVISPTQDIYKTFLRNALIITAAALAMVIIMIRVFSMKKKKIATM